MRKKLSPLLIATCIQLMVFFNLSAQTGTWTQLTNLAPTANMGVMLLLTDGRVICHDTVGGTVGQGWYMLTPDATGSYVNGTWTVIASSLYDRYSFASQVLPSGKVLTAGGEYGAGATRGEVYDPVANTWTATGTVVSNQNIYDGNSEILPDGRVLVGVQNGLHPSYDNLYYTPGTNAWTTAPISVAPYNHDESQWVKLPDSSVLFVGIASTSSVRYRPQTNSWVNDATVPVSIYDTYGEESGCGMMLPNGKAILFGATQHNAIYTPSGTASPGSWSAAADFPSIGGTLVGQPDAPGAMMVNGHILLACSPLGTRSNEFQTPTYFVEYNYLTNSFTQVTAAIPGFGGDSIPGVVCQEMCFLDLPDGNVLVALNQDGRTYSRYYWIYTPGSGPIPQGKPTISSILPDGCPNYKITGKLFNGISEGSSFGDDLQNSTNYPLVRLTNGANVYYAKTTNWNRIGALQTDSLEDTAIFTLPVGIPSGTYSLVVVVNGFASNPTLFTVLGISSITETNINCITTTGSASVTALGQFTPLTYSWAPGGYTNSTISNLNAGNYTVTVTDGNGCTVSASATIVLASSTFNVIANSTANVNCNGGTDGIASSNASGGTSPFTYSWSNGAGTNSTATGLIAGSYTVTAYDYCGNSETASVIITQPASGLGIGIASQTNVSCNGTASGSVTANSATGGTSPYSYAWSSGGGTNLAIANLAPGNYTITATDNNGCIASDSVVITQPAPISISADTINATSGNCNGSAWAIVSGGNVPYTYLWTGGLTTDTIINQCSANYCCTITDANGCIDSICVTINISSGISNLVLENGQISIYPNPNNGKFTIEINDETSIMKNIEVFNVLGEQIYSQYNILNSTFNIDLSAQPSGIYFYRVLKENGGLLGEGKIVLEK